MSVSITKYTSFKQYIADGTIDLENANISLALVTSSYTPSIAHTIWADVSANEVATGSGYSTGGTALTTPSVTAVRWDADDVTFSSLTKTFRYGVIYINATVNSIVKPLIAYILFDTTPADTVIAGNDFTVQWDATGIMTFA